MAQVKQPPQVAKTISGEAEQQSLISCIAWFLDNDARVNVMRHPAVNELFLHRQTTETSAEAYQFASAEDRFALGVFQAVQTNNTEKDLHGWITDVLVALDDATKTNEAISEALALPTQSEVSALERASKIEDATAREVYLTACWLEVLCTAEARTLGWIYQSLYGRAFAPNNF